MPLENLTRARIRSALNLLGLRAQQERVELELCIYGGSAMMLAYSSRETTAPALENHQTFSKLCSGYEMLGLPLRLTRISGRYRGYQIFDPEDGDPFSAQVEELVG